MTIQISDSQLSRLESAAAALRTAISRNRVRFMDVALVEASSALDEVLGVGVRSQSEQSKTPGHDSGGLGV